MFKIGDRVICISKIFDKDIKCLRSPAPKEGKIYTVNYLQDKMIGLKEMDQEDCFGNDGFRKVDETFAKNILENILTKVKEVDLV